LTSRGDFPWARQRSRLGDLGDAAVDGIESDAQHVLNRYPRLSRLAALARDVQRQQSVEQLGLAASGAAFWLVICALPTGAAVVSLYGLVASPANVANDLGRLARATPGSLGSLLTDQLRHVAAAHRTGLSISLAVSLVLAVWSASAGVYNLDRAVRYSFGLPRRRWVEARARALGSAFVLVVVLGALSLCASIVGGHGSPLMEALGGKPAALLVLTVGITVVYRSSLDPSISARRLLPGAACAAVGLVVALAAFAAYLALSPRYTAIYGASAGLVIGMIGAYIGVYAVLLGAVIDARLRDL